MPSTRRITTDTLPSGWLVTAKAGDELAAPMTITVAALTPSTPSPVPPITRRRKRDCRRSGPDAPESSEPYLRSISRHRLSSNLVIAAMLLSEPVTRSREPFAQHDRGHVESVRSLLRGKPRDIDELDCLPLDVRQARAALEQRATLALGIDPAGKILDLVRGQRPVSGKPHSHLGSVGASRAEAGEHARRDAE
jgi:hypothetical protein